MADVSPQDTPEQEPVEMVSMVMSPQQLAMTNPFGDRECSLVELAKVVNAAQLQDEIEAAAGCLVQIASVNPCPEVEAGPDNPVRLYVTPPLPERLLDEVVAAHEPDDDYGLTPHQRERRELLGKLRNLKENETLSVQELQRALMLTLTDS
jgi:hypothetical protein